MKTGKSKSFWLWIVLLLVGCSIVLFPLLRKGFFVSDDGTWMIIRLSAFYQSLREGQFPVRYLGRLNYSYGYPVANFLYPGFLYLGSLIRYIGFTFVDTVKILLGLSVSTGALFTFLWLKRRFSGVASAVGAMAWVFSPYLLFDLYKRGSVGEILAMATSAIIFYAIERGWGSIVALAVGFLIISHNTLALLFLLFISGYIFIRKKYALFIPVVIGAGLSTFFWLPALVEQRYVIFNTITVSNPISYFLTIKTLDLVGFVTLFAFSFAFFTGKKEYKSEKWFFMIVFLASVFMASIISLSLWRSTLLVTIIQFPFRILSLSIFAGVWLVSFVTEHLPKKTHYFVVFPVMILLFLLALPELGSVVPDIHEEGYYTTNEGTTTVANEYMPRWVKRFPEVRASDRIIFYQGKGKINLKYTSTQKIDAEVTAEEPSIVQVNSVFYPGWGASLDNQYVPITPDIPQGLILISVPPGTHNLHVEFRETVPRFASDVMSGISIIILVGYMIIVRRKKMD